MRNRILLLDADVTLHEQLARALEPLAVEIVAVSSEAHAASTMASFRAGLVIVTDRPGQSAKSTCDRLAKTSVFQGVALVGITATLPRGGSGTARYVAKSAGLGPIATLVREAVGDDVAAEEDEDALEFALVPDEDLAPIHLSRLPSLVTVTPAAKSVRAPAPPRPRARSSRPDTKLPVPRMATQKTEARTEQKSLAPPRPGRPDAKPAQRTSRPDTKPSRPPAARTSRPDAKRSSRSIPPDAVPTAKRVEELTEQLASARRERDESDAAWSQWVTSAERFAGDLWIERENLRKANVQLQQTLAGAQSRAESAAKREVEEKAVRDGMMAELAKLRESVSKLTAPSVESTRGHEKLALEVAALRTQLADAVTRSHAAEAARVAAEGARERLRIALEASDERSKKLAAERERKGRASIPPPGAGVDREELRTLRERLAAEQKRAIALGVENSALRREGEAKLKAARAEAITANAELRTRLESELRARGDASAKVASELADARVELRLATQRAEALEATLNPLAAARDELQRVANERESALADLRREIDEVRQNAAFAAADHEAWARRTADEFAADQQVASDELARVREAAESEAARTRVEFDRVTAELRDARAVGVQLRAKASDADQALAHARDAFETRLATAREEAAEALRSERDVTGAQVAMARAEVVKRAAERDALAALLETAQVQIAELQRSREALDREHGRASEGEQALRARVEELTREVLAARERGDLEARRAEQAEAAHAHDRAESTRVLTETQEDLARVRDEMHAALAAAREESDRARAEARSLTERLEATQAESNARDAKIQGLERESEASQRSREEIVEGLTRELQEVHATRAALDAERARAADLETALRNAGATAERDQNALREILESEFSAARTRDERTRATLELELGRRTIALSRAQAQTSELIRLRSEAASALEAANAEAQVRQAERASENAAHERDLATARASTEAATHAAAQALADLESLRARLQSTSADRDETARTLETIQAERDAARARITALEESDRTQRTSFEQERAALDAARHAAESACEEAEFLERETRRAAEQTTSRLESELARLRTGAREREERALAELATLKEHETRLRTSLASAEDREQTLRREREQTASRLARALTDHATLERTTEALRQDLATQREAATARQNEIALERDAAIERERGARAVIERELDALRADREELRAALSEAMASIESERAERVQLETEARAAAEALEHERAVHAQSLSAAATSDATRAAELDRLREQLTRANGEVELERTRRIDAEQRQGAAHTQHDAEIARARADAEGIASALRSAQEHVDELAERAARAESLAQTTRHERDELLALRDQTASALMTARHAADEQGHAAAEARERADALERSIEETRRDAEARLELLRTQSAAALNALRSRTDGDNEKVRQRFTELEAWVATADQRSAEALNDAKHQRELRERAESAKSAAEQTVRSLGSRLEVERAAAEELTEALAAERALARELRQAATRESLRPPGAASSADRKGEIDRLREERVRLERELSEQIAELAIGLTARDAEIATLRQRLSVLSTAPRRAATSTGTTNTPRPPVRARTTPEENTERSDAQRRADRIEADYTERLIAIARGDSGQVMAALRDRIVALQNEIARTTVPLDPAGLEAEIIALRQENEFLLAEIERNARTDRRTGSNR